MREAWWVREGGSTTVALRPDDRLRVVDLLADGREAQLTVLPDAAALGLRDRRTPIPPGTELVADREAIAIVAAPPDPERDGLSTLPGVLLVEIERAQPHPRPEPEVELPPPLAEPRLELRVDPATARSYEVRAGEYIEIIDVRGRQCSDFLAFHARKLQDGLERGLDAAATRTLTGRAFPEPGLGGRFFDADLEPLCELVRDTVGRHDAFALACTRRYYEDLGYPGHPNCTDNFNAQLAPFGIAPRGGWAALNFFYNTAFDAQHLLVADEPWSRPGDSVLLRACTDLVCASSACPDDVDPSNGWEVTDVHVRVYAPEHRFSMAIARRTLPDEPARLTRETAFHPRVSALTGALVEHGGFWHAERFDGHGAIAEYWACRERVAVMDLSSLRKWEVLGPDAETLVQRAITRDARRLAVGQVVYTALCHESGGMLDDATIFRLGPDNFRLVGGDDRDGPWLEELAGREGLRAFVKPATDALHNLAVQGPASRDVLAELIWTPPAQPALRDLRWFRFLVGRIGGRAGIPVVVSRTGYTGELGYEVFCHPDDGVAVWDAIMAAGAPHGIAPLGLEALELLRVEAGLALAGHEFDDDVDPFEAGIGFTVSLDGGEGFVGREALAERRAHPQRALVGLRLDGGEVPGHGDGVYVGRTRVGVVTSAIRSPMFQEPIALARLAVQHTAPGTAVEVSCDGGLHRRLRAEVTAFPRYDPEKRRPRS
ncbi:MAG: DUF1989 domain-containing protein [Solirubrobacteraceae bacterium]|nr:DUF1989 domain-containing protein [Solirubrobacteraceae bacterium]